MSSATPQPVSVLSAAKNGLVYLTPNDWALIVDKAVRMQFDAGDAIVPREWTNGLYDSERHRLGADSGARHAVTVNPGEACGEISFLDELPATADVLAKEPVEAYFLDRATLQTLFELFPHLGSRFYHSMAAILARRLRELITPAVAREPVSSPKRD